MPKSWYNMTPAKAEDGAAEILLYDIIGAWGISAKQFAADLKALKGAAITLRINSPGGDVIEGAAICNILKADGRPVTSYIDGMAASMASVIPMVGKVIMPSNALMMVHNPWTVSMGDADQLRKDAGLLDKIKGQIVGAYEAKVGAKKSRAEIVAMMDAETWMDGSEAVAAGFADECGEAIKVAACAVDVSKFAAKVDARVAALMPKVEAPHDAAPAPAAIVAPVAPPAPVLLDAVVVESRIESEKALAFQTGAASRQSEVDALAAERDALKTSLATAQGNATQLQAALATEKTARINAEKAHAALMGGVKFTPSDQNESKDFIELQKKYGHEEARKRYPAAYSAFMKEKAPGTSTT
jgi:ATP-dependent protease ClpP protease subunit